MTRFLRLAPIVLAACGSPLATGGGGGTGGSSGGGGAGASEESAPPVWKSPLAVEVPLGLYASFSGDVTDPDGDAFTVSVLSPAGVRVSLVGKALEIHSGFESPGAQSLKVELVDEGGAKGIATIDAEIQPLAWLFNEEQPLGPSARQHPTVVTHEDDDVAYLLHGIDPATGVVLDDVWGGYVGGFVAAPEWSPTTLPGDPLVPADGRRAAGSMAAATCLLFGGHDGTAPLAGLHRLAGGAIHALAQPGIVPPGRSLHVFAHDAVSDRYVVFGGMGAAGPLGDTWILEMTGDVPSWTEVQPAVAPGARSGAFHGLDPSTGRLFVFGGNAGAAQVEPLGDTWVLDVRADPPVWAELAIVGPSARADGAAAMDGRGPNLWVFGGTSDGIGTEDGVWVLEGWEGHEAWHQVDLPGAPSPRNGGFGIFHADFAMFGYGAAASAYRDLAALGHVP